MSEEIVHEDCECEYCEWKKRRIEQTPYAENAEIARQQLQAKAWEHDL